MSRVIGVVLAAGLSSRMGDFKPLLDVGGETAAARVLRVLREGGVSESVVVTGHARERLTALIAAAGATEAENPDFQTGMFSSIRAGLKAARALARPDGASAFLLMPADCPLLSPAAVAAVTAAHETRPERFAVACYRGKKGHPLLIPARAAAEIEAYAGAGGLKAVTDAREDDMIRVETGDEGTVTDMDTPQGYAEVLRLAARTAAAARGETPPDTLERYTGRIFLVRHGETRRHADKIFLGQTDVPLSDEGRRQAEKAASELSERGARPRVVYASDLSRAAETAEIIAARLTTAGGSAPAVIREPDFREMSLGRWDGRLIGDVVRDEPAEYARRGEHLLRYKRHGGENFYDLRFRAVRRLRRIAEDDLARANLARDPAAPRDDLLIVAHAGVIRALLGELTGLSDEAAFAACVSRGEVMAVELRGGRRGPL